jgi:hypothetical protein
LPLGGSKSGYNRDENKKLNLKHKEGESKKN